MHRGSARGRRGGVEAVAFHITMFVFSGGIVNKVRRLVPGWFATMIVASAAVCIYGISQPQISVDPQATVATDTVDALAAKDLYDVLWLDHYPEMASDKFKAYSFTSDNVGITMDFHSAYKLTLELFEFKAGNTDLTYHFPHSGTRAKVTYKVEKLKKPTKHFDTQLTIDNDPANQGKTTIYFTGPNFRSLHDLPSPIQEQIERSGAIQQLENH